MKKIILLFFLFLAVPLMAQQTKIDSLKNKLSLESNDSIKLKILDKLNEVLFDQASLDKALPYFNEMKTIAIKLNLKKIECKSYRYITEYYMRNENFGKAKKVANKSLSVSKGTNDTEQMLLDLNLLARVYHHFQKYTEAIKIYNEGINLYKKKPTKENSINAYLEGLDYADKLNDSQNKFMFLNGLGWTFISLKQYTKAEKYLLRGLNDSLEIKNEYTKASLHRTIGLNYSRWGKYKIALKHDKIALKYFHNTGNKLYEFDMLNSIGVVYLKIKKPAVALGYFKRAHTLALEIKNKFAIWAAENAIGSTYIDLKQYTKAKKVFLNLIQNTTIIENVDKMENLKDLNGNLKLKKEKAEQNLVIVKEKQQKWLFVFGLIASLFVIVIGSYFYQKNKKQKLVIENLQKELHHRIKNNLAIIDTFIEVAKEEFNNTAFTKKLTELQNRVASINQVHQQLYASKHITNLGVKKYVETLANNVQKSFDNKNIEIIQHIDDSLTLNAEKAFSIGLIINEFLTNSFKYAFDTDAGNILIDMEDEGSNIRLFLSDNGKGLPLDFNMQQTESFGLRIMKLLSEQLKGSFKLDGTKGVRLTIQFPK